MWYIPRKFRDLVITTTLDGKACVLYAIESTAKFLDPVFKMVFDLSPKHSKQGSVFIDDMML